MRPGRPAGPVYRLAYVMRCRLHRVNVPSAERDADRPAAPISPPPIAPVMRAVRWAGAVKRAVTRLKTRGRRRHLRDEPPRGSMTMDS